MNFRKIITFPNSFGSLLCAAFYISVFVSLVSSPAPSRSGCHAFSQTKINMTQIHDEFRTFPFSIFPTRTYTLSELGSLHLFSYGPVEGIEAPIKSVFPRKLFHFRQIGYNLFETKLLLGAYGQTNQ